MPVKSKTLSKHDEDMLKCKEWIKAYIRPHRNLNHIYTSLVLWQLVVKDTNADITHEQFKFLMHNAGYDPANTYTDCSEYHISSAGLRKRPKAKVGGWLPSLARDKMTRYQ